MKRRLLFVVVLLAFYALPAFAQTEEGLPFESAGRDHFFLGFTGYVLPRGTCEFTAYDLFIWEFGYGIGDGLEVGAQLSPSLMSTTFFYSFSMRYQIVSRGSIGLATYTSYTGLTTPDSTVAYANAIIQGLALTGGSRRLILNLPVAGLATNIKGSGDCNERLDPSCEIRSTWRFAAAAMPGFSFLIAEPEAGEQVRGMVEVIAGIMPGETGAWLVMSNIGIRWEDRGYLADVGVSVPIATGYGGKPFGDALRWGGWVVPLVDFSVGW
jgi:hypothetical protein